MSEDCELGIEQKCPYLRDCKSNHSGAYQKIEKDSYGGIPIPELLMHLESIDGKGVAWSNDKGIVYLCLSSKISGKE